MDIERKGLFMGEPTNAERAQRAARVLTDYKRRHDPGEDAETVLTDLLADLLHYCDKTDLDFAKIEERARGHYLEES